MLFIRSTCTSTAVAGRENDHWDSIILDAQSLEAHVDNVTSNGLPGCFHRGVPSHGLDLPVEIKQIQYSSFRVHQLPTNPRNV